MTDLSTLTAISPLDGRYRSKVEEIAGHFSEAGLMRYRVRVEVEWLVFLCNELKLPEARALTAAELKKVRALYEGFTLKDAERIKKIEETTNHDVKAVEYFVKEVLKKTTAASLNEFVHFGCTSEDINNLAYAMLLKEFGREHFFPLLKKLTDALATLARKWKSVPMLARTHGQPASPTTVGKELYVFVHRLQQGMETMQRMPSLGKMNGAVGNYNAHVVAYPKIDWMAASKKFIESLGLMQNTVTTQIESHDHDVMQSNLVRHINTILLGLCRDLWMYISYDYFTQKTKAEEVGSSTMPHKVNPIDFENAEGNLGIANALLLHYSEKLPISRMQRDLSDSTVFRTIGVALGHAVVAYKSILRGLEKLELNEPRLRADLDAHWEVLAEAIQTVLRKHGKTGAYETLKALTRGKKITMESLRTFIETLDLPLDEKKRLLGLTPARYTGLAENIVEGS